jgi:Tol biopolymer transport system component
MAAPFSLERLETTGPPVVVIARLMQASNESMPDSDSGAGQYSVSGSGTLVAVAGGIFPNPPFQPYWVDRSGRAEPRGAIGGRTALGPRLSPDGRRVAFRSPGLDQNIWIYDIQRNTSTRLTSAGDANFPAWTPNGRRVAFSLSKAAAQNVWWQAWDGSGNMERLTTSEFDQTPASWTRDGRYLALVEAKPGMRYDILVLRMADRKLIPFAVTKSDEAYPEFSPDGRWLAYASNELERNEIYLRSFPDGKRTLRISDGGGIAPLWAPDGRELFYWNLEYTRLMKVEIVPGQDAPAGTPKVLFEFTAGWALPVRNYDISPDGRRFLIRELQKYNPKPVTELNLVRNWFEELRRLSPAGK